MQVMHVAQPPIITNGASILGSTLPCIRKKWGSFECRSISRGPT
jgi:hypothetical protein